MILITGGAGFIGAHVARELIRHRREVILVDDFNDRYDPQLKHARIEHLFADIPSPPIEHVDIRDIEAMERVFAKYDIRYVIHLAAWAAVQQSIENPHIYSEVNVDGTVNVLELARAHDIEHVVFASSSSVYGGIDALPYHEDMDISKPVSPYAATKVAGEAMCAAWHSLYGIPITALRFFTVYGPWGRPEMALFKFAEAMRASRSVPMRGRKTMRDFTYIDDIVQGVIAALDTPNGYRIFNLGEGDGVKLPRLIRALENSLGVHATVDEVDLPPGDVPHTLADISRARQHLGYEPQTPVEDGVQSFIEWYQDWYEPNFMAHNST